MMHYPLDSLYTQTGHSGVKKPGSFSNRRPKAMRELEQNALPYKFPQIVFPYPNPVSLLTPTVAVCLIIGSLKSNGLILGSLKKKKEIC